MREIRSGDVILRIRASSLSILFYQQEFNEDIVKATGELLAGCLENKELVNSVKSEMKALEPGEEIDPQKIAENLDLDSEIVRIVPDGFKVLKLTWALHKTQNVAEKIQTPSFEDWIIEHQDISVNEILWDVIEEATQNFFRQAPEKISPK